MSNLDSAQFAYEKNKMNIYDMLLQKKSSCNMCVISTPLEKLEKSRFNIIFFFVLHIIIEAFVLLFVFELRVKKLLENTEPHVKTKRPKRIKF